MRLALLLMISLLSFPACGFAAKAESAEPPPALEEYADLQLLTDVLAIVRHSYVEEVPFDQLVQGAVRGLLATLDPHSSFMSPEIYREMQIDTEGEFGGLGIEVTLKRGELIIVAPMEGTPADRAGLMAGDRIVRIDEEWTDEIGLLKAVELMRGSAGSEVTLSIDREGLDDLKEFTMTREIIKIQSVRFRRLDHQIGYLRIAQFQQQTSVDLVQALKGLMEDGPALRGIILDLRNNPGGLLDQAVAVADLFLKEGLIVYTEGREEGSRLTFTASDQGIEPDLPMVVLIDSGSASASEIVAGALQDQGKAVLLGQSSFGKGSVQSIIPLQDESALRLTTARYFTPSGTSIQARGIKPDVLVKQVELPDAEVRRLREADLEHHISAGAGNETETTLLTEKDRADVQLLRAIDLLTGWQGFQRRQSTVHRSVSD